MQKEVIVMIRVTGFDGNGIPRDVGFQEGTIDEIRKTLEEELGWKILYIGYEEAKEKEENDERIKTW